MYFKTLWISPLEKQYVYNMDVGEELNFIKLFVDLKDIYNFILFM